MSFVCVGPTWSAGTVVTLVTHISIIIKYRGPLFQAQTRLGPVKNVLIGQCPDWSGVLISGVQQDQI